VTGRPIAPPPAAMLKASLGLPKAVTVLAEVRTDSSIPFDPGDAPPYLSIDDARFGALVLWRVDVPWTEARKIQQWLIGAPGPGAPFAVPDPLPDPMPPDLRRENALRTMIENMRAGAPPGPFAEYLGTYLQSDTSHARYTMAVALRTPVSRTDYQTAWLNAIAVAQGAAPAPPPAPSWYQDIVTFLKLMLGQASSEEEFVQLASNVGDLAADDPKAPGTPKFPMIKLLIT
jgi:hypothetical protein